MSNPPKKRTPNRPLQSVNQPPAQEQREGGWRGLFGGGSDDARRKTHEPIIKSLEKIGLNPPVLPIEVRGEVTDCICIPLKELVHKEYQYMSGIDIDNLYERANLALTGIKSHREEQEDESEAD